MPHVSGLINWVPTISSPASFFLVEEFIGITTRVELAVRVTLTRVRTGSGSQVWSFHRSFQHLGDGRSYRPSQGLLGWST